jgi:hypothetical protein
MNVGDLSACLTREVCRLIATPASPGPKPVDGLTGIGNLDFIIGQRRTVAQARQ